MKVSKFSYQMNKSVLIGIAISVLIVASGVATTKYIIDTNNSYQAALENKKIAQNTLDEFYSLASRVKVGINQINYAEAISKLKVTLDKLERETPNPLILANLKVAFTAYSDALVVWKYCNEFCWILDTKAEMIAVGTKNTKYTSDNPTLKLLDTYSPPTVFGGFLVYEGSDTRIDSKYTSLNIALSTIWA
jgi:hypothetical protein